MATYKCPDCGVYHDSDVESDDQFLLCPDCTQRGELHRIMEALNNLYVASTTEGDITILSTAEGNEIQITPDGNGYQVDFVVFIGGGNTGADGFDATIAKIARLVNERES